MRRATVATAALLAGLVTSCSSDPSTPTVAKATNTPPASSPTPTPSPSPSPSQETFQLGDTADISAGGFEFSASVRAYQDKGIKEPTDILQAGQKWAAVEVKVCNTGDDPFAVTPFVWSLAYEDGARVEPTHMSGGAFPKPLYPLDAKVRGQDCVRGNVLFEVPKDGRAERVLYSPQDVDEPVEWQIGK